MRMYKTCIRPIMIYSVKTQADMTKTKQLLKTNIINVPQTILGKIMINKVNNSIRELCGVEDVDRCERTCPAYARFHNNKKIMNENPDPGRPR